MSGTNKKNHGILEAKADSFLLKKKKKNWFFSYLNGVSDWVQVIPCTLQLVTTFFFFFFEFITKKEKKNYIGSWFLYIYVTSINMSSIKNNTYHRYKLKKKKLEIKLTINCLFWYVVVNFRIITLKVPLVFCFHFLKTGGPIRWECV